MKNMLLLLLCLFFIGNIVEAKIVKDSLYQIPKTKVAPVIDGLQDNVWKTIDWNMQRIYNVGDPPFVGSAADSGAGLTGMSKAMWDENNLYILFYSVDDVIIDIPANPSWNQDAITLAIDGSNDHSTETSLKPGQIFFTIPHWLKGKEVGHLGYVFGTSFDTTGIQFRISDVYDDQGGAVRCAGIVPADQIEGVRDGIVVIVQLKTQSDLCEAAIDSHLINGGKHASVQGNGIEPTGQCW